MFKKFCIVCFVLLCSSTFVLGDEDISISDFESETYEPWQVTGNAFGKGPAKGPLPGQMNVEGFQGSQLVNSFNGGDGATGHLDSPSFKIERSHLTFLMGGGGFVETSMQLHIDGKVVRTACGPNTTSGGSERLERYKWDVTGFIGKDAFIRIVDIGVGGWGHINVDDIVQTNDPKNAYNALQGNEPLMTARRTIKIDKRWLNFPVTTGAELQTVQIQKEGKQLHRFSIELSQENPLWFASVDMASHIGSEIEVVAEDVPASSWATQLINMSDEPIDASRLYDEPLRSQFHFSPQRGWTNDPNGLVYYKGEYHLFFQHNPYGWAWGNMHWGHAVSSDLIHWREVGEALYPDDSGTMFSGSAVVDWNNTSGFGTNEAPPLVLAYTAAGNPLTQCIAYSSDGRNFTKFTGNPVLKNITAGNRDPKIIWHEPTKRWVMVLYVEGESKKHTIRFYNSADLKAWELTSVIEGGTDADKYLFECPDFFELPVDDDKANSRWVLTGADSQYAIGTFDGRTFTPEISRIRDVQGAGYYAAQTFSDVPDGRRIQIGWIQAPSPGMSFNQLQSIPVQLSLRTTPAGIRLHHEPVVELKSLRGPSLSPKDVQAKEIEFRATLHPVENVRTSFEIRGAKFMYNTAAQELHVNEHKIKAPLSNGSVEVAIYIDRTVIEVFASNGLAYAIVPFIAAEENQSIVIDPVVAKTLSSIEAYELKSIWP
jgi:fructan beta-fructosidase